MMWSPTCCTRPTRRRGRAGVAALSGPAERWRRARLDLVPTKGLAVFSVVLAVLSGAAALGSVAGASAPSDPIAQAEQPETEAAPSPSDSDGGVRLAMALLIAVAVIALLGTLVYWVRAGDAPRRAREDSPGSPARGDTLR